MKNKQNSACALFSLDNQPCVKAFRNSKFPKEYKKEIEMFISRNVLPDCGRVPPNCLKAHMIKTAKEFHLNKIPQIKKLFRSRIGFKGYYLDAGKLRRV